MMISYGFPKGHMPVRLPNSYDPGPLVGITRSSGHMHTGVLWVICVFGVARYRTCTSQVHARVPYGSLWIPYGHVDIRTFWIVGTVRSSVDAVRAWKYPYDHSCWALRGSLRPASARSGYIYQAKHDYVTFDLLGPGRLLTGIQWERNRW